MLLFLNFSAHKIQYGVIKKVSIL